MAQEQAQSAEPASEAEAPAKGSSKLLLPIIVAVATVAGGVVGVTVVAPRLIAARTATAQPADTASEGEPGGESGDPSSLLKLENLIVNPAGAQGTHFLMVSVAVEAPSAKVGEELRAQELRVRDLIVGLLERQTMQDLGVPGIRETLKGRIADTVGVLMGQPGKIRVLLPQFVVQ